MANVLYLLFQSGRQVAPRWAVRAFTSPLVSSRFATRTLPVADRYFTSKPVEASIEEDLDAQLDGLFEDTFSSSTDSSTRPRYQGGSRSTPRDSFSSDLFGDDDDLTNGDSADDFLHDDRPKAPTFEVGGVPEDEDGVDFKDPELLQITNPRWTEVGLDRRIVDILSGKGFTSFTPVQAEAFKPVLAGRDVIGRSRTGTGKTLAFGLPSLTRIKRMAEAKGIVDPNGRMKRGRRPSMIVLCPTRELARQVSTELSEVAKPLGLRVEVFYGGVSYDPQARALRDGIDVLVGTPGRIMDHQDRGNLDLRDLNVAVLDEADEMLNMGFADDVERILYDAGSAQPQKMQCLMFSATTPSWVKEIGRRYQENVVQIDATKESAARTATTVRHLAIQMPMGVDQKQSLLEDIIAVEISKERESIGDTDGDEEDVAAYNPIAAAALKAQDKNLQQKIFGKTIVFVQMKREADELVSGSIFKSLTAQALHGDVGQKQRDATLQAFRKGAFNVLVATDVAARGIDIKDVDLVIQFDPPRDVDTYVHRSGRTGRAGKKGVSILLYNKQQEADIVKIERSLGHGFKFDLVGPPSYEAALRAAAKTSAVACMNVKEDTAEYFKEAAEALLQNTENPEMVVARCLAAVSKRTGSIQTRSLLTGQEGYVTLEMSNNEGRPIAIRDVMFTVGKLSRLSNREQKVGEDGESLAFDSDVGRIEENFETGTAIFDMPAEDARKMMEYAKDIDAGGAEFQILTQLEVERGRDFGRSYGRGGRGGAGGRRGGRGGGGRGGRRNGRSYSSGGYRESFEDRRGGGGRGYRGGYGGGGYSDRYGGSGGGYTDRYSGGDRYGGGRPRRSFGSERGGSRRSYSSDGGGSGGGRRDFDDDGW